VAKLTTSEATIEAYNILNLKGNPSAQEIRKSYMKFAMKYHPDTKPDASPEEKKKLERKFIAIQEAYEFLMNPGVQEKPQNNHSEEERSEPQEKQQNNRRPEARRRNDLRGCFERTAMQNQNDLEQLQSKIMDYFPSGSVVITVMDLDEISDKISIDEDKAIVSYNGDKTLALNEENGYEKILRLDFIETDKCVYATNDKLMCETCDEQSIDAMAQTAKATGSDKAEFSEIPEGLRQYAREAFGKLGIEVTFNVDPSLKQDLTQTSDASAIENNNQESPMPAVTYNP
jgi:curved DNA-binding protein CbpA